jgi:flagellar basal body-associated protein FliL
MLLHFYREEVASMKCINCHKELKDGAKFCTSCGAVQPDYSRASAPVQPVKKKKKSGCLVGFLIILIIMLILVLGIGGGVAVYTVITGSSVEELLDFKNKESDDEDDEDEDDKKKDKDKDDEDNEDENDDDDEKETEESEKSAELPAPVSEETTAPETSAAPVQVTMAQTTAAYVPITASVVYASQASIPGISRIPYDSATVFESSHIVQDNTSINNSGWMAFDGDAVTSWQVRGNHGIGQYVGVGFAGTHQVRKVVFRLGNHRSDTLYAANNIPKTLTVNLGSQVFQVTFPAEKTEFALVLSAPVEASSIRVTINDVYLGSKYDDAVIAEIGVYGN